MSEQNSEKEISQDQPQVMIDGDENEVVESKGVSFLSGVVLVVLVVAAIGSFSIVAMELGEIKRLVGLKESTGEEIKENEKKILNLKEGISKLIENKKQSDESAKQSESNARKMANYASGWEKIAQDKASNSKENTRLISDNSELISEISSLNKTLSSLKSQKSLLETQIKDLESAKEELSKYPVLIANKKAELDKINAQKQLAVQTEDQAESALIELKTQITSLEQEKKKVLAEKLKSEELVKVVAQEQAKLDEIKVSILAAEKASENKSRLDAQIAILEKRKNDVLVEKIQNEELAKSALAESIRLKAESSAKLEQKIESEERNNYLVQENSRLQNQRDLLKADISKLNEEYKNIDRALQGKKAEAQNQSN